MVTCFPHTNDTAIPRTEAPYANINSAEYKDRYYNGSLYKGKDPKKMNLTQMLQECCWPGQRNCDCIDRIAHEGTVLDGICHGIEAQRECLKFPGQLDCCDK
ncbi:unnamed protein product [Bursaphelenchus xylophilus]|uniref:(pine wood nematode) hypothetical protein n=1 Tax=Bursaphelenchus xylophilus TaxID=6326 RepID=A0A1I7S049_BURXY|nr:unnamed protein product [Bursaphelenchus xylophilus]CAG9109018.1 unnamed protein product [Bursaphelenchus xylophilus]